MPSVVSRISPLKLAPGDSFDSTPIVSPSNQPSNLIDLITNNKKRERVAVSSDFAVVGYKKRAVRDLKEQMKSGPPRVPFGNTRREDSASPTRGTS